MKKTPDIRQGVKCALVEFTLSCSLRFLFTSDAGLLVMLTLTNFLLDACLCTASLEAAKCTVQRFILFYDNT